MEHSKEGLFYTSGGTIVRKCTRSKMKRWVMKEQCPVLKAGETEENINSFTVLQSCLFLHFWHLT